MVIDSVLILRTYLGSTMREEERVFIPDKVLKEAKSVIPDLLSIKSKSTQEKEYDVFCDWRRCNDIRGVNEDIVLTYFSEKSQKVRSIVISDSYNVKEVVADSNIIDLHFTVFN